jgi:glycosyltransferase involved in cell wall biosynthesis
MSPRQEPAEKLKRFAFPFARCKNQHSVKLLIVHHHFRPGGVRRVIELAAPAFASAIRPRADCVTLATGEAPDVAWLRRFEARMAPLPVTCRVAPSLNYLAEQRRPAGSVARRLRRFLGEQFRGLGRGLGVVWAHNQSLGRNPLLTRELARICAAHRVPLVLHHHDWWFDNRWIRWAEMRRAGFRTLAKAAKTIFVSGPDVRHVAINQPDAAILQRHFPRQSGWVPNLMEPAPRLPATRVGRARRWLRAELGEDAPVWLLPCRLLRRKNIAEALLLSRWLRPEAWLVTTGGVSSTEERHYAERLRAAARHHGWRLRLGLLQGDERHKPPVPELLAASEAVVLTSLQEGFGLPYLEAAAARRPLIARTLPNIAPDLEQLGFRFPQGYADLLIAPTLFDWQAEQRRQRRRFGQWLKKLPRACRRLAGRPALLALDATPRAVPFSRLTLTAQLEVLAHAPEKSWNLCAPFNLFLSGWRERAKRCALRVTPWPRNASHLLGERACARRFGAILARRPASTPAGASLAAQQEFIRRTLHGMNLYPLTWTTTP